MTFDPTICDPCEEDLEYYDPSEDDGEPVYFDLSDDADALASAGWGTDEDYGGCCDF